MKQHQKADKRCSSRCLRWYYIIEAHDEHGKRKREWSRGYPTKTAAQQALTEALQRRNEGIILERSKLTLREYVQRWLDHMATLGRDERTIERYGELLRLHVLPYLGGLHLRDLTPLHLTELYATLLREGRKDGRPGGLAPRTVGHVHRALHRSLRQAVRWRLLARNPATDLAEDGLPSVPKSDMVTLTREQAAALLKAAERRPLMRTLVILGVATGARLGELLALRWDDVDLAAGTIRIGRSRRIVNRQMQVKGPKTEAGYRTVVVGPATVAALTQLHTEQSERRRALGTDYHTDEDLVVCKPDGTPYRPDSVSAMFRTFVDDAGLPKAVHTHTLRHSAASFLAAAGVPASDLAAQLGHKDGGALALKVYVHPMAEGLARAGAHLDQVVQDVTQQEADTVELE